MITKHDREQFIILSLNVRCYGNIPLNQANIIGEGKRRNEFAEWHVAWLAE